MKKKVHKKKSKRHFERKYITLLLFCILIIGIFFGIEYINRDEQIVEIPEVPARHTYIPQYVLLAFDGAKDISIWEETRKFAKEMNEKGKPLSFTYFINAAYFLTEKTKYSYTGPEGNPGYTTIGVANNIEDLKKRIVQINNALNEGHEIGSHTVGHFSGKFWSKEDWEKEFKSFEEILFGLDTLYPGEKLPKLHLTKKDIIGFRAPYLDHNSKLYDVLPAFNFKYDSSQVSLDNGWPQKDTHGVWRIPLGTTLIGFAQRPIIAMDYNIYNFQTNVTSTLKKGTPEWEKAYKETYDSYKEYFDRKYNGDRAPVLIGHHFEDWNDNLYWEAMKSFAEEVCGKQEVECVTFRDLVKYLDTYGPATSTPQVKH